jgi:parvulin-like peptidyl-prolyl isomerase
MKQWLIVALALLISCANQSKPKGGVISVNGVWLKKDNIDKVVELYKQQMYAAFPQKALDGLPPGLKKNIAHQLIANEVALQEAKKRAVTCNPARLAQMLDAIKKQYPDSATLDSALAKLGQTRKDMEDQVREGLLIDTLIKSLTARADSVPESECKAYYEANTSQFASEKRFRVSQILFTVQKSATPAQKKAAAEKAAHVLAEIKAGKDFAAAAKKYSQDHSTAVSGGDIGWFKKGDLKKEFDQVATPLTLNEVSGVFETDAGFHIAKKTGEETLPPQPYEKARDQIQKVLSLRRQNDIVKHFIDSLISAAKIVYVDTSYGDNSMAQR